MNAISKKILSNINYYKKIYIDRNVNNVEEIFKKLSSHKSHIKSFNSKIEVISLKIRNLSENYKANIKILRSLSAEKKDLIKKIDKLNDDTDLITDNLPNVTRDTLPIYKDKIILKKDFIKTNKEVSYIKLIEKFHLVNIEDTNNIYGRRYSQYINKGARLIFAIINYCIDKNINADYDFILPPVILSDKLLLTTGQLPKFKNDLFQIENNKFLSPTSEVQLINYYKNKIVPINKLPISITSYTQCFRKEVGSAGQQNKTLLRQHQFNKVEIVKLCLPEHSDDEFNKMNLHIQKLLKELKLSYIVKELSKHELGFSSSHTYDYDVFFPATNEYIEISSLSNCLDFQSIKGNIRTLNKQSEKIFLHTLNGSSLAVDRIFAAIVENNYDPKSDTIKIPAVLHKYLPFKEIK